MPRVNPDNPDKKVMEGFPDHGDSYSEGNDPPTDPPADPPKDDPKPDPYEDLKARLEKQEEELSRLRQMQTPPQPKDPAPAPNTPPEDNEDFETRFYKNPRGVLEEFGKEVEERTTKKLEAQYRQERANQKFWDDFFEKHPDLKQDRDLVDLTLRANLDEIGSMPVNKAIDRVADLTRERILRYAGGAGKARSPKAKAEGASPPSPPKPAPADDKIMSITELIKKRKGDRRRAASGV